MNAPSQPPGLYDAHVHLADARFDPVREMVEADLEQIGLRRCVVNGTHPGDWPPVLDLARRDRRVIPATGLHPWRVNAAPANWRECFLEALDSGACAVGEIGLDRWIKGHDIERQRDAFRWQLEHAARRNLPVSIHCLKALGLLLELLGEVELPERGFHLHAYSGPLEAVEGLVALGAYFSFNAGQLRPGSEKVRAAIRSVPSGRILVETDAPDFLPPEAYREFELPDGADGSVLCHPANLRRAYKAVAEVRGEASDELQSRVAANFEQFFIVGNDSITSDRT